MKPETILKKHFQRNFLMVLMAVFFAGTILTALVIYFNIEKPLGAHYSSIISVIVGIRESLIIRTITISLISFFLIASGSGLLALIYTHRIAGPLFRIKQCTKAIAEGNLDTKITLRNKDAVNAFADSINQMTEHYGSRVSALSYELQQLRNAVENLYMPDSAKESSDARDLMSASDKRIHAILETINSRTDQGK